MSSFRSNVHVKSANVLKGYNKTHLWKHDLQEKEKHGKLEFVPVEAFSLNLIEDFTTVIKKGVMVEIEINDYEEYTENVEIRWFAEIVDICGYRVLMKFVGLEEGKSTFWANILSADIHHVGSAQELDPEGCRITYAPPNPDVKNIPNIEQMIKNVETLVSSRQSLAPSYEKDKKRMFASKFKIGDRLELLNYNDSRVLRPARIQNICGRRLNVLIERKDYSGDWLDQEGDRQLYNRGAEYWIDQESFFIFPVGWASYNGYKIEANPAYKAHSKSIAEELKKGGEPKYSSEDTKVSSFSHNVVSEEDWAKVKVGQRCELIDPLAQQFQDLKPATILKKLESIGYVVIGMDGPDVEEDSLPLHVTSPFIFPAGYAKEYDLKFTPPTDYDDSFNWDDYLKEKDAEKMPIHLFKPEPSKERMELFKVGGKIEAADMCENQLVCPALIKEVKGRILNVGFDGWGADFDELYDVNSHDIFPVGWCEIHGYPLQKPETKE